MLTIFTIKLQPKPSSSLIWVMTAVPDGVPEILLPSHVFAPPAGKILPESLP